MLIQRSEAGSHVQRVGSTFPVRFERIWRSEKARAWLLLTVALGTGAFLRLWRLDSVGFSSDEAVYAGQAAAIAQDPRFAGLFPVFRAHPLLFHVALALVFRLGVTDLPARLIAVALGLLGVCVVYRLGGLLYGRQVGAWSALFVALMPYHVVVTRQVLLDGPMTLFATLASYLLARFASTQRPGWLYAAAAGLGLTFLAKETGIVLLGSFYAFLALSPEVRVRLRDIGLGVACLALVIAPFPLSLVLAGGGGTGSTQQYLVWQLLRRPNHGWAFYLTHVPAAVGPLLLVAALVGLWLLRHQTTWREKLLLSWIVVPALCFQFWPVKGFQYLLPAAPPLALLAARAVEACIPRLATRLARAAFAPPLARGLAGGAIALTLLLASWGRVRNAAVVPFLAGSGGVAGGREAGQWVQKNVPEGATLMTIGPSMANILQFYGHRRARGLSVSPNPLHRNPSYQPIGNPDLEIRNSEIQYLVWDWFSAARSSFFGQKLLEYARRYNGRVVHVESITVSSAGGAPVAEPIIIIYQVHP